MTSTALHHRSSLILAAGGLSWLAKMAVIAATDGADDGAGSAAASVFYLLGVTLMAVGLAGLAVALARGRALVLRAAAGIAGLLSFFGTYVMLDGVVKPLVGDAGPAWLDDEAGILVTGAVLMAVGLLAAQRAQAARQARPAG